MENEGCCNENNSCSNGVTTEDAGCTQGACKVMCDETSCKRWTEVGDFGYSVQIDNGGGTAGNPGGAVIALYHKPTMAKGFQLSFRVDHAGNATIQATKGDDIKIVNLYDLINNVDILTKEKMHEDQVKRLEAERLLRREAEETG